MTGRDPAVEAAKRAEVASQWWTSGYQTPWDSDYAEDAAREALAPIRDLHKPKQLYRNVYNGDGVIIGAASTVVVCEECNSHPTGTHEEHCDGCELDYCDGVGFERVMRGSRWPCSTARLVYESSELEP